MNVHSINTKSASQAKVSSNNDFNMQSIGKKGQIVEGLITKVSHEISITFDDREVSFPSSAVRNAKEGEIRRFEIMDVSEKSIVLKEVGNSRKDAGSVIHAECTNVETDQTAFKEHLEKSIVEKGETEKKQEEAKDVEGRLKDVASRMTGKDYEELIKEGDIQEVYDIARLDKALVRVKEQLAAKEESVGKQVEDQKELKEKIENSAKRYSKADEIIVKKLKSADLPVTDENIGRIKAAMELAYNLGDISDKEISYLIRNGLEPTIENLYKAGYSSCPMGDPLPDAAWNEVVGQAELIIQSAGLEVKEENLANARWLIEHDLPLTKETLLELNNLIAIDKAVKEEGFQDAVLDKIITAVSEGRASEKAVLSEDVKAIVEKVLDIFRHASDEAVVEVVRNDEEVTASTLEKAGQKLKEEQAGGAAGKDVDVSGYIAGSIINSDDIRCITARRQLEEIRLKMTVEAGHKLLRKGFRLDTDNLSKIVEGLREMEDSYYRNLLNESNTPDSLHNVELLKDTTEKVNALKGMPSYLLGVTLNTRKYETIDSLYEQGTNLKSQIGRANKAYDAVMTAPRSDLGDSIQKAFDSIDAILADMDIESTEANRRAVKILGYNSMEITSEAIDKVKDYDAQVNKLMKELHPAVAVNMIREGVNPLDTPIYELNRIVQDMKDKLGPADEEKYSKYLWKLEKGNSITEDEKKTYIGIYRLLNNVLKTDGAALGAVVKADQEVTLNHLLTAVRTMRSQGIDNAVDDSIGRLESLKFSKEKITDQVDSAYQSDSATKQPSETESSSGEDSSRVDYMNTLLQNIMDEITPGRLNTLNHSLKGRTPDSLLDMSLEKLSEKLSSTQEDSSIESDYADEKMEQVRELAGNSKNEIMFLQDYHIPTTLNHLMDAKEFLNHKNQVYRNLKQKVEEHQDSKDADSMEEGGALDLMNGFVDALDSHNSIMNQFEKLDKSVDELVNKELADDSITSTKIVDIKKLSSSIHMIQTLGRSQTYYIPLLIGNDVTNINLTIINGTKESGKIDMNITSRRLGTLSASFSVKGSDVKGLIMCDNRETLDAMKRTHNRLEQSIHNTGFSIKQLNYGIEHKINETFHNYMSSGLKDNSADTKQLYQIAKAFVYNVRFVENGGVE